MKGRLFLVHRDAAQGASLAEELAAAGWQVDLESDGGGEAYRRMSENPPDVVVVYLDREPSHGIETGAAVRNSVALGDVPLVFVNGNDSAEGSARVEIAYAIYIPQQKLARTLAYFELR